MKFDVNNIQGGPIPGRVRVRFAPSPTGSLHVGGARSYLFNYIYAKSTNGTMVLRIEDTDQERSTPEFEKMVINDLMALDLPPNEGPNEGGNYGPYRQSEREDIYKPIALLLLKTAHAYRCFCTEEELDRKAEAAKAKGVPPQYDGTCTNISNEESEQRAGGGEAFSIRMKAPRKDYTFTDRVRGEITFKDGMVGDFVILRSNGVPVYNYAVVVDDYLMRISNVIRAEEHLPNTLRQLMIYEALGWQAPEFAHISLVLGLDRKKLSKRHGATSVQDYLNEGYLKEALVNYLALLGWSPPDMKEIRTVDEIAKDFHLEKLNKAPAIFDPEKLQWMNGEYIRAMDLDVLMERVLPFVKKEEPWLKEALAAVRGGMRLLSDIGPALDIFYPDTFKFEQEALDVMKESESKTVIQTFKEELNSVSAIDANSFATIENNLKQKTGAKGKKLFFPLRASITGKLHGPELKLVLPLIGKNEALRRADLALKI